MQPGCPTVQGALGDAIHNLLGETVVPQGSGRTDAGVHALGQVASFSSAAELPVANLRRALNRTLPSAIRIVAAEIVPASFHARHSATGKTYEYRVFPVRRPAEPGEFLCSPFLAPYVWACRWPLNITAMNDAAAHLLGEHDFTSFAASDPDRRERIAAAQRSETQTGEAPGQDTPPTNIRRIRSAAWTCEHGLLIFRVTGNGFLHHMVRNLVGTLAEAGRGRMEPAALPGILAARDRTAAGPTAPAQGLFLHSVEYAAHASESRPEPA